MFKLPPPPLLWLLLLIWKKFLAKCLLGPRATAKITTVAMTKTAPTRTPTEVKVQLPPVCCKVSKSSLRRL